MKSDQVVEAGARIWVGFQGTSFNGELKELIDEYRISGFVLFRRNIESSGQLKELTSSIRKYVRSKLDREPNIAVDQEGGSVRRLFFVETPSAEELGKGSDADLSSAVYKTAVSLRSHGINVNLAPVLDVATPKTPEFLRSRCFGSDPALVARIGSLWIELHQKHGIRCVAKHYPGLGRATLDPHKEELSIYWLTPQQMWQDLQPFSAAVSSRVWGIMVSHASYPLWNSTPRAKPAFMSDLACREWLRKRLSFQGIVFSDDLDMGAVKGKFTAEEIAWNATMAGVDCFLVCNDINHAIEIHSALVELADRDKLFCKHHSYSAYRLLDQHRQLL
ncbi:glycoside hydrolase family 3 N-terminal domain-containing protein [Thermodesulforhabdus norvegica]|uniref:Beta-N-acetylhexosaminidase n=1 Tax=Thermodesulforhabdus norvegica TaxID=39841 RepID=A0A1I4QMP9_9BACT|nr:glycoside hydrolase family 3 N-terminal domain-containing protein [Thermodesulforhabdus norvegica]SFM41382.1 beta-N-acetylhexosaminidase [Thermodesulforhabdus norvegica]